MFLKRIIRSIKYYIIFGPAARNDMTKLYGEIKFIIHGYNIVIMSFAHSIYAYNIYLYLASRKRRISNQILMAYKIIVTLHCRVIAIRTSEN